jgi:hypothetical protein
MRTFDRFILAVPQAFEWLANRTWGAASFAGFAKGGCEQRHIA